MSHHHLVRRIEDRTYDIVDRLRLLARYLESQHTLRKDQIMSVQSDIQAITADLTSYAATIGPEITAAIAAAGGGATTGGVTAADVTDLQSAVTTLKADIASAIGASVTPPPSGLTVTPATLPTPSLNVPYSATLTPSGGISPYAYVVTSGSLPIGLVLDTSGSITGTPTASGVFTFGVEVSDSTVPPMVDNLTFTVAVA